MVFFVNTYSVILMYIKLALLMWHPFCCALCNRRCCSMAPSVLFILLASKSIYQIVLRVASPRNKFQCCPRKFMIRSLKFAIRRPKSLAHQLHRRMCGTLTLCYPPTNAVLTIWTVNEGLSLAANVPWSPNPCCQQIFHVITWEFSEESRPAQQAWQILGLHEVLRRSVGVLSNLGTPANCSLFL